MTESGGPALANALGAFGAALAELGAPYMVIGGMAVIAHGVARVTDDVDATVWAENLALDRIFEVLAHHRIVGRIPDATEFARAHQVLLLHHEESGTPMELSLAWLPFEREAIAHAETTDLLGTRVPVAAPEDLVIYKAVAWRDRDRGDIERLLVTHRAVIDLPRVRRIVAEFAEALNEPERVGELEALIERAVGGASGT